VPPSRGRIHVGERDVTALPDAANAGQLTATLRRHGFVDATVRDVAVESSRPTILSRITRLRLAYYDDAAGAPLSLILKTGQPERTTSAWPGGRQEVAFYQDVAAVMPG